MDWLTKTIHESTNQYNQEASDELQIKIFHSIQIWGGNSAKMFYSRNGGVENNFDLQACNEAATKLRSGNVNAAIKLFQNNIRQMNIAFASKQFSFWTYNLKGIKNEGPQQLPVLFRLIFNVVYGSNRQANYRHYSRFLNEMYSVL